MSSYDDNALRRRTQAPVGTYNNPSYSEFGKGLRRFGGGVGSTVDRLQASLLGSLGYEDAALENVREAEAAEREIQSNPALQARVGRVEDIHSVGDALDWAASVGGENLPLLGGMAVTGGTAGLGARALGAGSKLTKAAGMTGAAVPYYGTTVAETNRDLFSDADADGTVQSKSLGALGGGALKTAAGMVPIGGVLNRLTKPGLTRGTRALQAGTLGMVSEGGTEAFEGAIGDWVHQKYNPAVSLTSDEAISNRINEFAGGALLGGTVGTLGGALAPSSHPTLDVLNKHGLGRSADRAAQRAVREGRDPLEAVAAFAEEHNVVLDPTAYEELGAAFSVGAPFQPTEPGSSLDERIADLEAEDELNLKYMDVFGKSYADLEKHLDDVALMYVEGKVDVYNQLVSEIINDPQLGYKFGKRIDRVRERYEADQQHKPAQLEALDFLEDTARNTELESRLFAVDDPADVDLEDVRSGTEDSFYQSMGESAPSSEYIYNFKGEPWASKAVGGLKDTALRLTLEEMPKEARVNFERLSPEARQDTKHPERKAWDEKYGGIDEYLHQQVPYREALETEARESGMDIESYIQEKAPGVDIDDMSVIRRNRIPAAVDPVQATEIPRSRINPPTDKLTQKLESAVNDDLKQKRELHSEALWGNFTEEEKAHVEKYLELEDRLSKRPKDSILRARVIKEGQHPLVQEYRGTEQALGDVQREIIELKRKARDIRYSKKNPIMRSVPSNNARVWNKRIKVQEYKLDKKEGTHRWVDQVIDPMELNIALQDQILYDPDTEFLDLIRDRTTQGLTSLLDSRTQEVRLDKSYVQEDGKYELPDELIVYTMKHSGLEIPWGAVRRTGSERYAYLKKAVERQGKASLKEKREALRLAYKAVRSMEEGAKALETELDVHPERDQKVREKKRSKQRRQKHGVKGLGNDTDSGIQGTEGELFAFSENRSLPSGHKQVSKEGFQQDPGSYDWDPEASEGEAFNTVAVKSVRPKDGALRSLTPKEKKQAEKVRRDHRERRPEARERSVSEREARKGEVISRRQQTEQLAAVKEASQGKPEKSYTHTKPKPLGKIKPFSNPPKAQPEPKVGEKVKYSDPGDNYTAERLYAAEREARHNPTKELALGNEWLKKLGVGTQVHLADVSRYLKLADHSVTSSGATWTDGGKRYIYISPLVEGKAARLEVMAHELGHVVYESTWGSMRSNQRKAVLREFDEWRRQFGRSSTVSDVTLSSRPENLLREVYNLRDTQKLEGLSQERRDYLLDFEEWFADNTAKWLVSDAKPRTMAEQFFSQLADLIRDLHRAVFGNKADDAVASYLNSLWTRDSKRSDPSPQDTSKAEKKTLTEAQKRIEAELKTALGDTEQAHGVLLAAVMDSNDAYSYAMNKTMRELIDNSAVLSGPEKNILLRAFNSKPALRQLNSLLARDSKALAEIQDDPVAAAAYGYQFWKAGELKLGPQTETVFQKIAKFLRDLLGIIHMDDQALQILDALKTGAIHGDFVVQQRVRENLLHKAVGKVEEIGEWIAPVFDKLILSAHSQIKATGNQWLIKLMDQIHGEAGSENVKNTMLAERNMSRGRFLDRLHEIYDGKDEAFGQAVSDILNKVTPIEQANSAELEAAGKTYALLQEIFEYANKAGVNIPNIGTERVIKGKKYNDYYPRVVDVDYLQKHKDEFIAMLSQKKYEEHVDNPEAIYNSYIKNFGDHETANDTLMRRINEGELHPEEAGLGNPKAGSAEARKYDWLELEDIAPYLSKDLGLTMSTYISQMTKRAEYRRRFSKEGGGRTLEEYLNKARETGASEADIDRARKMMQAVMGTLGSDIDPRIQKMQGWVMVYENYTLLLMATLTSLVDVMGIAVRGDLNTAFHAYRAGLRETIAAARSEGTELSELGEALGILEKEGTAEALGFEYGGYYVTGKARKLNDWLFRINGLQAWTRQTRLMALAGAKQFLVKHGDGKFSKHSRRWMQELALRDGDVKLEGGELKVLSYSARRELERVAAGGDILPREEKRKRYRKERKERIARLEKEYGHLKDTHRHAEYMQKHRDIVGPDHELSFGSDVTVDELKAKTAAKKELARDDRVRAALNRWVDGAILRPDAAQRPIWASDPRWMLVFHLKAFTYSFHDRILKRIWNELKEGNVMPVIYAMSYIPGMMLADGLRDLMQDDDDVPQRDFLESVDHSMQRAGLYGIGQFARDAFQDAEYGNRVSSSFEGPFAQHVSKWVEAIGSGNYEPALWRSSPGQVLYRDWGDDL